MANDSGRNPPRIMTLWEFAKTHNRTGRLARYYLRCCAMDVSDLSPARSRRVEDRALRDARIKPWDTRAFHVINEALENEARAIWYTARLRVMSLIHKRLKEELSSDRYEVKGVDQGGVRRVIDPHDIVSGDIVFEAGNTIDTVVERFQGVTVEVREGATEGGAGPVGAAEPPSEGRLGSGARVPASSVRTTANERAERECAKWLASLPAEPRQWKNDVLEEAKQKWGANLSDKAFERAWRNAPKEWRQRGRPRKGTAPENTAPKK